ncbi:hypothetical protein [Vibrio sp. NH-UV-68]|uniref:hypothetical protein n=1 Tax=unclassified Vibrio TaxID=2614977 RepID=UPI002AAAB00F|nr:hypothetical protein [uncultured Vibrio sp.]
MESRIPLPTDNIYKFYALFGLLLVIFGLGSIIYVNQSTNSLVYDVIIEYHTLKNIPVEARTLVQEATFQVLDKKLDVAVRNKFIFLIAIGGMIAGGIYMLWYGFKTWHTKIQPMQDEMARLNIKKLKQEVGE